MLRSNPLLQLQLGEPATERRILPPSNGVSSSSSVLGSPTLEFRLPSEASPRAPILASIGEPQTVERFCTEFDGYEDLGKGDFGSVTTARSIIENTWYAIKRSKEVTGARDLQSKLQEVYALSSCHSPHILRYYDAWIEDDRLHIRTELTRGNVYKLFTVPWEEMWLWNLLLQIGIALHSLHTANVAHIDVKPDNIFWTIREAPGLPDEIVFLLGDFGLARPITRPDSEIPYVGLNDDEGDNRYLSPDFINDSSTNLAETDVYALGASLFELAGGDLHELRTSRCTSFHRLFRSPYSDDLIHYIERLLSLNPQERPTPIDIIRDVGPRIMGNTLSPREIEQLEHQEKEIDRLRERLRQLTSSDE